jgi:Holliday junction resolvase-like predicted endonuclease
MKQSKTLPHPNRVLSLRNTQFKGLAYEKCARAFCRRKGFKILSQNLRLKGGEIDCLAWDDINKRLIVVEVRGRSNSKYPPARFISHKKIEKLKTLALSLVRQKRCAVRIYLLEVKGNLPKDHLIWGLEYFPERLGLTLKDYQID